MGGDREAQEMFESISSNALHCQVQILATRLTSLGSPIT